MNKMNTVNKKSKSLPAKINTILYELTCINSKKLKFKLAAQKNFNAKKTRAKLSFAPLAIQNKRGAKSKKIDRKNRIFNSKLIIIKKRLVLEQKHAKTKECKNSIDRKKNY